MIPLKSRIKSNKAHYIVFCIVFFFGIATSLALYFEEEHRILSKRVVLGALFTEKLQDGLKQYAAEQASVVALIQTSEWDVSPGRFSRFVQSFNGSPGVNFYFAQYVPGHQKREFETRQYASMNDTGFRISPEGERHEYLPITLRFPDKITYGYDLLSAEYLNHDSISSARNSLGLTLSNPISIPSFDGEQSSKVNTFVLRTPIFLPVDIRSEQMADSVGFHGIVGAYFTVDSLLKTVGPSESRDLFYRMADIATKKSPVWFSDSADTKVWEKEHYNTQYILFAGREWRIDTSPTQSIMAQINWWVVMAPLFIFCLLALVLSLYTRKLSSTYYSALSLVKKRLEVDELTGLLSRYQIQKELNDQILLCEKEGKQLATLVLDLDHFKTINDAFGHELGDKLLTKVSKRLVSVLPEKAIVGHLGGDAFLVLLVLDDSQDQTPLDALAKDVIQKLSQSYFVDGLTLDIGCSIGVALYPEFGLDGVTLIKNADMAVYQAKTSGRATYHFYDGEMGRRFARNVRIETRLRQAISKENLELHFQPKVDLVTERCVGMEALLRWNDEELGSVSPAEFVPIAEQTGIIIPLGDWVFEQAFKHILEWQELGIIVPPIAVNCSAAQLKRVDFLPKLLALLDKYKIDPSLLEIEVTESILIEDAVGCAELLRQISRLGMKLAIDDFGTGYSSLSYLKDLPFHYVKIDQVFIRNIIEDTKHEALTHAIISMSHDLGLKVIAEGITNADQLQMLKAFGCDIGQGYLFSKALGANTMSRDPMIVALNEQGLE
ncbi:bifunctional diguanylate cyclase/phosphodiesterase [Marinomonas profundimaris]|uniref:Diguanylate cyclase n=1 Tax=Marinomonas profundimaris TaxID=1208321 RepID=W1S1I6_9GAMM|nr:EAL domain-containing protein [Marinomonas profundimaris]ETI61869.1 diguanylate cyclase [Marinomonas profundimaris]